jgi:D-lyxose ketol-isomerase
MDKKNLIEIKNNVIKIYNKSKIVFTEKELKNMEVADLGLGDFYNIGLAIIIYVNTSRVCAKELALTPYQICPQHLHPDIAGNSGKEETFRCRWGEVYLYISGPDSKNIRGKIPDNYRDRFSVFHEIILKPGDQYTLEPNTWHWFQGGEDGAVLSEFSTHSYDAGDIFYDKEIKRIAVDN